MVGDKYPAHTAKQPTTTYSSVAAKEQYTVTEKGSIGRVLVFVKPNVMEYEIEAEFLFMNSMHHSVFSANCQFRSQCTAPRYNPNANQTIHLMRRSTEYQYIQNTCRLLQQNEVPNVLSWEHF
jgi:hypothetical protein